MGNITSVYRTIALVFVISIPVFAICFLTGWYLDRYDLKSGFVGQGAVNPVTAICFIFLSVAFLLSTNRKSSNHWGTYAITPVIAIAIIRLAEIALKFPSNVSEIF